ncbi:MAG: hypothetical protein MRZ79_04825 [Bacteroidia bacterium]|nr:hypothetical protein [Bacteroidia bacterium]
MASLKRPADKPYCIGARIKLIIDETRRKEIFKRLNQAFDRNRLSLVLNDRVDDITFTEARIISQLIGCQMEELYQRSFDFNELVPNT